MADSNVLPLRIQQPSAQGNVACPCGEEWWDTAVVLDQETWKVVGHIAHVTCRSCGMQRTWEAE